ncbi:MAG TPA: DUF6702 family protein [Rhodothermales bacterium]|nr:DUF6702 family protein [Rhodothermales bacterium]
MLLFVLALLFPLGPTPQAGLVIHDFHISYGRVAVEDNVVVFRVRFFKDDLEEALRKYHKAPEFALEVNPAVDAQFVAYFNERLVLETEGQQLTGQIIGSGEEMEGKEPMWWYALQYEASATIKKLTIKNQLLLELFDDQKNIVKVRHFPDDKQQSYYFDDDTVEHTASF